MKISQRFNITNTLKSVFILFLLTTFSDVKLSAQPEITLEKMWKTRIFSLDYVRGFNFYSGNFYNLRDRKGVAQYNIEDGKLDSYLYEAGRFQEDLPAFQTYHIEENEGDLLLLNEIEKLYRRSFSARYYHYSAEEDALTPIGTQDTLIMKADASPDGERVAYLHGNNIFVQNLQNGETRQITQDGKHNFILNGHADWVYEEEFVIVQTYEWSPDSRYIAYLKFDESQVPKNQLNLYTGEKQPGIYSYKYPRVGEKNADVSLHLYDLVTDEMHRLPIEAEYIPRIRWRADGTLLAVTMNRHQNHLQLYGFDPESEEKTLLMEEKNEAYIELDGFDQLQFLSDGSFLYPSEQEGWMHIYHYDKEGQILRDLTPGKFDVTDFYGYDEESERLFYQAATIDPKYREIFSVGLQGDDIKKLMHGGSKHHSAQFSEDYSAYILKSQTINNPPITAVYDISGNLLRTLEDNRRIKKVQKEHGVNPVEYFDFEIEDGIALNGWMIKPNDFDPNKKYPVFMYQYSGPASQTVTDTWKGVNYWWFQMLADKGYLIACVDGRGTGTRGEAFRKMTYMKLGYYETKDQIAAANHLSDLPYVDGERIGIFGWSYGGYISTNALFKGSEAFSMAIAVAPVTHWKWYDTIYTERYMRTDKENEEGYEENSPVNYADRLEGNYLLIVGLSDDNVLAQHSLEMIEALVKEGKEFETMVYPNSNHSIHVPNSKYHLYKKMTKFIENNL